MDSQGCGSDGGGGSLCPSSLSPRRPGIHLLPVFHRQGYLPLINPFLIDYIHTHPETRDYVPFPHTVQEYATETDDVTGREEFYHLVLGSSPDAQTPPKPGTPLSIFDPSNLDPLSLSILPNFS